MTVAGPLSNNKGINKQGGGLSAEALTEKDKRDILTAAEIQVDYLAVSFPRSGADLDYARKLALEAGSKALIVAKVERRLSVADEIGRELDQALARSERLRQSILKRAFEGRLVR